MSLLAIPFPAIDPVLIQFGPLAIRWYALAYIAGILLGWWLARRLVARPGWLLKPEQVDDLVFYITLGVILGGRLGYVFFYKPLHFLYAPWEIPFVWQGGMSFHGGLVGVLVAMAWFARKHALPFLEVADPIAVVTPVGLFFGRLANFINAELWGRPSDVPWAVVFPNGGPIARHPSQLYEGLLEGALLFAVLQFFAWRPRRPEDRGFLGGIFLAGYAVSRMFVELFREPDAHLGYLWGGWLTMGQLLSVPVLLAGIWLILRTRRVPAQA